MIGKTPKVSAPQGRAGSSSSVILKTTGLAAASLLVALAALGLANGSGRATAAARIEAAPQRTETALRRTYGQLPLSFEPNRGQASPTTDFLARGAGYSIALQATRAMFALGEDERLRMELRGADTRAHLVPEHQLPGTVNYLLGNERSKWRTGIPTYARLRANDVYPGIDLAYYGKQGRFEYDLLVHPGASPKAISLGFAGARKLRLDGKGNLVFQLGGGALRQLAPRVYQQVGGQRHPVAGRFVLRGQRVSFALGDYDRSRTLVIDPVLVYSTYLGGSIINSGSAIAVDAGGSAYVAGWTGSTDFPTAPASPLQATNAGGPADAFVAKLNPAGTALVYSTYLGGGDHDEGQGIAVDSAGSAYLSGSTSSIDFPTAPATPLQAANAGGYDAFVAKLNAAGTALVYSTYLGGSGSEYDFSVPEIAVDAGGSAYLTGYTESTDFPTAPASPLQATNAGGGDAFVAKLDPAGTALVYSTYLGGSDFDEGRAIAVDSAGSAYLTGVTYSINFPTASPLQAARAGLSDAFVAKLDAAGTALVYSTYLGGSDFDEAWGIDLDAAGSAYLTGSTNSLVFPTAPASPLQAAKAGDWDAFVAKLNAAGTALVYSSYLGGNGFDGGEGIAVDSAGSAYMTGGTDSTNFPTADPLQVAHAGGFDAFVTKLDAAGTALVYSTYLGGGGLDIGDGIDLDAGGGSAYLTGYTESTDLPTAPASPLQATRKGELADAFVAKIGEQPGQRTSFRWSGACTQIAGAVPIDYTLAREKVPAQFTPRNVGGMAVLGVFSESCTTAVDDRAQLAHTVGGAFVLTDPAASPAGCENYDFFSTSSKPEGYLEASNDLGWLTPLDTDGRFQATPVGALTQVTAHNVNAVASWDLEMTSTTLPPALLSIPSIHCHLGPRGLVKAALTHDPITASGATGTLTVTQGSLLWHLLGERTSASVEGLLGQFDFTGTIAIVGTPTAVRLLSLSARRSVSGVVLRWRTAAGALLLGVNVHRGSKRLNRSLLGVSGRFLDRSVPRGAPLRYRLQAVHRDGTRSWLGTVQPA